MFLESRCVLNAARAFSFFVSACCVCNHPCVKVKSSAVTIYAYQKEIDLPSFFPLNWELFQSGGRKRDKSHSRDDGGCLSVTVATHFFVVSCLISFSMRLRVPRFVFLASSFDSVPMSKTREVPKFA